LSYQLILPMGGKYVVTNIPSISEWTGLLSSAVFQIAFSPANASETMDLFTFDIRANARRLVEEGGGLGVLWYFSEDRSEWVLVESAPSSADPTEYSMKATRLKQGSGNALHRYALLKPRMTPAPAPVRIFSIVQGNSTAVRDANVNVALVDSSQCKFSCIIAQNQLVEGTTVNVREIKESGSVDFLGPVMQVNSSSGIINVDYMQCRWECGTNGAAARRLLKVTEEKICKVFNQYLTNI
jgi:hypothetical protein